VLKTDFLGLSSLPVPDLVEIAAEVAEVYGKK